MNREETGRVTGILIFQDSLNVRDRKLIDECLRRLARVYPNTPVFTNGPDGDLPVLSGGHFRCLTQVLEKTAKNETDSVAILSDFAPLLDEELMREAAEAHFRYLCHFTYSENVPPGFLPDFASLEFLRLLKTTEPDDLRGFVAKNLDAYDVELFYKLPDLRQYRLDLTCASARSQSLARNILEREPGLNFGGLQGFIQRSPELLRPYPSYFEIELRRAPLSSPLYPQSVETTVCDLPRDLIDKLERDIAANGLEGDVTVCLGGLGEPFEFPEFEAVLARFLALKQVRRVYVETFGAGVDADFAARANGLANVNKLHIIFRLGTLNAERYRQLYGADRLSAVLSNIEYLERRPAGELGFACSVEMLKILDVEDEIEAFFDRFEDSPVGVVLQKFNRYIDLLPERRVSDLTPLHRDFCWHLARDFYLSAEGLVPLCKQDPFVKRAPGLDFRKFSVGEIFSQTMGQYNFSVRGEHGKVSMPCLRCDEWYTFNG